MRVFLSWSGYQSKSIAKALKKMIVSVFDNEKVEVFMSDEDIPSGRLWFNKIKEELHVSGFAIVCMTPSNILAPWIYYESGALSERNDILNVVPFLFSTELPSNCPLAQLNHIKYDSDLKNSEKSMRRLIKDVWKSIKPQQSTEKQIDLLFDNYYPAFSEKMQDVLSVIETEKEQFPITIYPSGKVSVIRNSVFISAPMSNLNENDYVELRNNILKIKEILINNCCCKKTYYAGDNIPDKRSFDGEIKAITENLENIIQSEAMVVIYPDKSKSSVLLEIGYAIALSKKIVIFTKVKKQLPFMLRQADAAISNLKIFEYSQIYEVFRFLSHNGKSIFC